MVRVSAFVGSIVDPALGAHVIINASNPEVALGSGVSGAIREACGDEFRLTVFQAWEDQFDQPLEPDDCLVTDAGDCRAFQWVLHVPAVDYRRPDPETGRPSGPKRVQSCMRAAMAEASELASTHGLDGELIVGAPLLGAGAGGLGEVTSAGSMMSALATTGTAGIHEIRFVVLEPHLALVIENAADRYGVPFVK